MRRSNLAVTSRAKRYFSDHFRRASERDRKLILGLNLDRINALLWPLFIGFLCLNFLDVYSTTLAMRTGAIFHENNPIASALFNLQFRGFLLAMVLKYLPAIPLFYLVFLDDPLELHSYEVKLVKFAALAALVAANIYLLYVVGVNNIPSLLRALLS